MAGYCLVTGASGGIGKAVAKKLADQGTDLFLHYHQNKQSIDQLISELPPVSVKGTVAADLSTNAGIKQLRNALDPEIDSVVFAHGNSLIELFQFTAETEMEAMLNSHVKAPWLISQQLLPDMLQKKTGKIILVSSIWGETGASCEVIYSSVKGAQNSFVKALGKELAPSGITVNGVLPGLVNTKMNDHLSEDDKKALFEDIPVGRAAEPVEIADVVHFLLNENTSYITGELIKVTGGW